MKKTTALLGFIVCALTVSTVSASPEFTGTQGAAPAKKKNIAKASPQAVHYITTVQVTGSHLPLVVCRYKGATYSQSPISAYGPQLDQSAQFGVAGELVQRDPAISSVSGRH